jgi:hypothetical protein
VDRFLDEIRSEPRFVAAAEREPHWLDDLDAFERSLDAMFCSDLAFAVAACDRIVAVVEDKAPPLKQRLLTVKDIMAEVVRRDG